MVAPAVRISDECPAELNDNLYESISTAADTEVFQNEAKSKIITDMKALMDETPNGDLIWKGEGYDTTTELGMMHTPLAQLYFIYYHDFFIDLDDSEVVRHEGIEHLTERANPAELTGIERVGSGAHPDEIFTFLEQSETSQKEGIAGEISEAVKNAKRIMLTGCISPVSAQATVDILEKKGFRGELIVADISPYPLRLTKVYENALGWQERGIEVTAWEKDLTQLSREEIWEAPQNLDIIISDILGHYLTDEEIQRDMLILASNRLGSGGFLLARDMAEVEEPQAEAKQCGKAPENISDTVGPFKVWLSQEFGYNVDEKNIEQMYLNLFGDSPHESRFKSINQLWTGHGYEDLRTRFEMITAPEAQNGEPINRIFPIYVIQHI